MTLSINDIHDELFEGFKYFLSQEKPNLSSDTIDVLAKQFADDNDKLFFYSSSNNTEMFGDEDVETLYCLSGHLRLWLCKMLDGSFKIGFDAGNGWYEAIEFIGEII